MASKLFLRAFLLAKTKHLCDRAKEVRTTLKSCRTLRIFDARSVCWVIFIMADTEEESEEDSVFAFKKPLELFEERDIVRICAPMVRYSK